MKAMEIKTMSVMFKNKLSFHEVPLLRGALLNMAHGDNILFHDHIGDKFRYSYPLVQYRTVDGQAAVLCLNDGIEVMKRLLSTVRDGNICIGKREEPLLVDSQVFRSDELAISDKENEYSIYRYLPLNQENYSKYRRMEGVVERYQLIEKCLLGNILSFAKSMGVFFEDKINLKLLEVFGINEFRYKKINMLGFDLKFKTNVTLPRHIALGKGVSIGFGIIK